jgi:hypothetical protein
MPWILRIEIVVIYTMGAVLLTAVVIASLFSILRKQC